MSESQELLEAILESEKEFIGEKQALSAARESTLQIDSNGEIQGFYGQEEVAVELLLQRFFQRTGEPGLRYTRKYLHKKNMEIPEDVELPESGPGLLHKIRESFRDLIPI